MIDIDRAIEQSKNKENISNGGSKCFDFGDVVLVKYMLPLKYVKPNYRARNNQELVMKGINNKNAQGVNTPKHIDMKRVVEGEYDICYVLQEKCKGKNCASMSIYGVSTEKFIKDLEYILKIPFKQYRKLVHDSCMLYEMGCETKNKNLFYDENTGFWFIDFLENNVNDIFDFNDSKKVFEIIKHIIPNPLQISSVIPYGKKLSEIEIQKINELKYLINGKLFLACKEEIPLLKKYEKFYLVECSDNYKKYMMENKLVDCNLFEATDTDLILYNELFEMVVNKICKGIINGTYLKKYNAEQRKNKEEILVGMMYDDVESNQVRCDSELFNLPVFFEKFINNKFSSNEFEDKYEYSRASFDLFTKIMMDSIYKKLCSIEPNYYIEKFIKTYTERNQISLNKRI